MLWVTEQTSNNTYSILIIDCTSYEKDRKENYTEHRVINNDHDFNEVALDNQIFRVHLALFNQCKILIG